MEKVQPSSEVPLHVAAVHEELKVPLFAPLLSPPTSFTWVEDVMCTCKGPITMRNVSFLDTLNLGFVLNVTGGVLSDEDEPSSVTEALDSQGIRVVVSSPPSTMTELSSWVNATLELLLEQMLHYEKDKKTLLIVGNEKTYWDCVLFACFRRLQSWSVVSALGEFRQQLGPPSIARRTFELEQFIEAFEPGRIDMTHTPRIIETYRRLMVRLH